jgi:hypothetical protein
MDTWFEEVVKPAMKGKTFMVRFADDIIVGFSDKQDALRVMEVLPKRFAKFGLTIHPDKTRLVQFKRPPKGNDKPEDGNGTFDFLGFTHYWGRSLKGSWVVKRKTASKRLRSKICEMAKWCRENMHRPVREQHKSLCEKLRGHFQYYGINGNIRSLGKFRYKITRLWFKWLNRRSRSGKKNWDEFNDFLKHLPLTNPTIKHSRI